MREKKGEHEEEKEHRQPKKMKGDSNKGTVERSMGKMCEVRVNPEGIIGRKNPRHCYAIGYSTSDHRKPQLSNPTSLHLVS